MNPLSTVVHLSAEPSFRHDTAGGTPILSNILFHNQPSDFLLPIFDVRKPIRIDSQYSKINQRQATSKSVHFGGPHLNRCRMFASVVRFFERKYMHELPFSISRVPFHIDCTLATPISILRLRELYNQIENMNQEIVL